MASYPVIRSLPADSTTWRTLAQPDGPGRLKGIGVVQSQNDISKVRITIDGDEKVSNKIGSSSHMYDCSNVGMNLDLPFHESLTVEIKDGDNRRPQTRFWVSYTVGNIHLL